MFKDITTRWDLTNAGFDVFVMLAVAFLLGFLYCYFSNKAKREEG
jgi:hypothetical protein